MHLTLYDFLFYTLLNTVYFSMSPFYKVSVYIQPIFILISQSLTDRRKVITTIKGCYRVFSIVRVRLVCWLWGLEKSCGIVGVVSFPLQKGDSQVMAAGYWSQSCIKGQAVALPVVSLDEVTAKLLLKLKLPT